MRGLQPIHEIRGFYAAANDLGADLMATGHYVVSREQSPEDERSIGPPTPIATRAISFSRPLAHSSLAFDFH